MLKKAQYSRIHLHGNFNVTCLPIMCYLIPTAIHSSTSLFCLQQSHPIMCSTPGHWPFREPSFPSSVCVSSSSHHSTTAGQSAYIHCWTLMWGWPLPVYHPSQDWLSTKNELHYLLTHIQSLASEHSFIKWLTNLFPTNETHWLWCFLSIIFVFSLHFVLVSYWLSD